MKLDWQKKDEIKKIIDSHCKEIPYEGTEVDKYGMWESICNYIENSLGSGKKQEE